SHLFDFYLHDALPILTYEMKADNGTEFQERYKALRKLLTTSEQMPIKFLDEPDTVYLGRLSAMDTVPDDSNIIISTFTIYCDSRSEEHTSELQSRFDI